MDIIELKTILDGGLSGDYASSLVAREGVQRALAMLNLIANLYENELEDELSKLVFHSCVSDFSDIDRIYRRSANNLEESGVKLDRWRLYEVVRDASRCLEEDYLTVEIIDNVVSHQLTSRSNYIEFVEGIKTYPCAEVMRRFHCSFDRTSSTEGWVVVGNNKVPLSVGEGDYVVLGFDGETKTAEISVDVEQLDSLKVKEALSICHELGHALSHIQSREVIGDFTLCLFDIEIPSIQSELLFAESISTVARTAFAIDCLKQSVFTIFSIMAPEVGAKKAFELATSQSTIYRRMQKDLNWILGKGQLFQWTGVPYIQYFTGFISALYGGGGATISLMEKLNACVREI